MSIKHTGGADDSCPSSKVHLTATGKIQGPCFFKVKGSTGSMFSSTEKFLVVSNISPKA